MRSHSATRAPRALWATLLAAVLCAATLLVPSPASAGSLPAISCSAAGSLGYCVTNDGTFQRAGMKNNGPGPITLQGGGRFRVELVYYDFTMQFNGNHRNLAQSPFLLQLGAGRVLNTPPTTFWVQGVFCSRFYSESGRNRTFADRHCIGTDGRVYAGHTRSWTV